MGLTFLDWYRTGSNLLAILATLGGFFSVGVYIWYLLMLATTLLQQLFLDQAALDVGLFPFDNFPCLIPGKPRLKFLDRIVSRLARFVSRLGPGYAEEDPDFKPVGRVPVMVNWRSSQQSWVAYMLRNSSSRKCRGRTHGTPRSLA